MLNFANTYLDDFHDSLHFREKPLWKLIEDRYLENRLVT